MSVEPVLRALAVVRVQKTKASCRSRLSREILALGEGMATIILERAGHVCDCHGCGGSCEPASEVDGVLGLGWFFLVAAKGRILEDGEMKMGIRKNVICASLVVILACGGLAVAGAPAKGKLPPRRWSNVADGFASVNAMGQDGTTGGAGGKTVIVTNQVELERYAQAIEPYIIRVKGAIKITPKPNPVTRYERLTPKEVHIFSDKTIIGVGKTGEIVGGGFFIGPDVHNVIIRNLTIRDSFLKGDWGGMKQDDDGVQMDKAHHVWIDHCHFSRCGDGIIDSRLDTTYLTVSWCILRDHNKTFGIGWTKNVTAQMTIHHNWFRNTNYRNARVDQVLRAHLYNNFMQNVGTRGNWANGGTNMILQNSVFENVNNPQRCDSGATLVASGCIYRKTRGTRHTRGPAFFDPAKFYKYTLDEAKDIPEILAQFAGPQESIGQ